MRMLVAVLLIGLVLVKDVDKPDDVDNLHNIGTAAKILKAMQDEEGDAEHPSFAGLEVLLMEPDVRSQLQLSGILYGDDTFGVRDI